MERQHRNRPSTLVKPHIASTATGATALKRRILLWLCIALFAAPAAALAAPVDAPDVAAAQRAGARNSATATINVTDIVGFSLVALLVQAGFAMVETGLTRSKNVTHTSSMALMSLGIGVLVYYACGMALMYGIGAQGSPREWSIALGDRQFGIVGIAGFFLSGAAQPAVLAMFVSQAVMACVAVTIPTGALAERWKFRSFVWFAVVMAALIYPVFGHWVWGGGWLARLGSQLSLGHGFVDFGGSAVIHMVGGVAALVGCKAIGPRIGKYNRDGSLNVLLAHSVPMYMVGAILLAVGFIGVSAARASGLGDVVLGRVATNTLLSASAGAVAAMIYMWLRYRKPDPSFMCNGLLAGLVAIAAGCPYVTPTAAVIIGLIAGSLAVYCVLWLERSTRLDDPVGAISVHAINGAWGVLAVGLFADGTVGMGLNDSFLYRMADGKLTLAQKALEPLQQGWVPQGVTGLFYGGGGQLGAQLIGLAANLIWVGATAFIAFKIIGTFVGIRVGPTVEYQGLDVPELGVVGYVTEDPLSPKAGSTPIAEPRAAIAPPTAAQVRFGVVIEGIDAPIVKTVWNELCQPVDGPADADFVAVYSTMTLLKGAKFRFSGGDPEDIRSRLERLFKKRLPNMAIRAVLES